MSARKGRVALEDIYRRLVHTLPGAELIEQAVHDLIGETTSDAWMVGRLESIAWAAKSLAADLKAITDLADEATTLATARLVSEEAAE